MQVESTVWAQARHCAHSSADDAFAKDIHLLHALTNVISTAFEVQVLSNNVHKADKKYIERACTEPNCKIIRSSINALKDFEEATRPANVAENADAQQQSFTMSCKALQGKFVWPDLRADALQVKAKFIDGFKALWTADLETFSTVISEHAISLDDHKEEFLTKFDVMDQPIGNVDGFN